MRRLLNFQYNDILEATMNKAVDSPRILATQSSSAGIMIAVFWLSFATLGRGEMAPQSPAVDAHHESVPMGNEAFAGTTTRGRVTQRFEIYNPHSKEQLEAVKEMGFTQVILDRPNLHAAATQVGLDVVLANWWTLETEVQEIEKVLELAQSVDPERLVAVSMMDEPERYAPNTPFSYYKVLYTSLRSLFEKELPGVKLEISHWGPLASWTPAHYRAFVPLYQATDRIRLMPYPDLNEGPLSEVYYQMVRSRRLMQLAGRDLPQVVILQTWVLPEKPTLPTIDELRVMSYQAILVGADTVSFFNYDPELWRGTAGFTAGFANLMRELTDFSRQYQNATVESRMSQTGILSATITPPNGLPISMIVNTNRTVVAGHAPLAVSVRIPDHSQTIQPCVGRCVSPCKPAIIRRFFRWRQRWCRHHR